MPLRVGASIPLLTPMPLLAPVSTMTLAVPDAVDGMISPCTFLADAGASQGIANKVKS